MTAPPGQLAICRACGYSAIAVLPCPCPECSRDFMVPAPDPVEEAKRAEFWESDE